MKKRNPIRYVAAPARVFVTLLILLIAVVICQVSAAEFARTFVARRPTQAREPLTEEEKRAEKLRSARREFLPDGTLHLVVGAEEPRHLARHEEIYDANGTLLWEGPPKQQPYTYLSWATSSTTLSEEGMEGLQTVSPDFRSLEVPVATRTETVETWRYCYRGGYFAGYATAGGRIGFVGGEGFVESRTQVHPFGPFQGFTAWCPKDSYSPTLLWETHSRLYQIDFEQRQVELLVESPQVELERLYLHYWGGIGPEGTEDHDGDMYRPLLVCRSADEKYHLLLRDPTESVTVVPPGEWDKWWGNAYEFTATTDAIFMRRFWLEYPAPPDHSAAKAWQAWWGGLRREDRTRWVELYRVSDAGALELISSHSWLIPARARSMVRWAERYQAMQRVADVFSPVLYDFVWWPVSRSYGPGRVVRSDFVRNFIEMVDQLRPGLSPWNWLLAGVLVVLTFVHGRPRRSSRAALSFWLVFVGLFNLAGFLSYWALNHTPTIACTSCGKLRGLHQTDCVRCGAPLRAPKPGRCDLILGV